jgi:hypothetical protein
MWGAVYAWQGTVTWGPGGAAWEDITLVLASRGEEDAVAVSRLVRMWPGPKVVVVVEGGKGGGRMEGLDGATVVPFDM